MGTRLVSRDLLERDYTNMATKGENRRFASLSDAELSTLIADRELNNNKRVTEAAVKIFQCYFEEKELDVHFENFASDQLDLVLCNFFTEARTV